MKKEKKASRRAAHTRRRRKKRGVGALYYALLMAFILLFCFSAYKLTDVLLSARRERDAFADLSALVAENSVPTPAPRQTPPPAETPESRTPEPPDGGDVPAPTPTPEPTATPAPVPLPQYAPLYEQNSDFFGWLTIEGTIIDYPVMYTPDRPEYYLNRSFNGSFSYSGVPFIDAKCPADGNYYLIYGHHMQNKTMFGHLPDYASVDFCAEHPIINFDTVYESRRYQVVAALYSQIYDDGEKDVFRYYDYADLTDEQVFNEYVGHVLAGAIYDTGVPIEYGDELLALSTCNYHTAEGRFVVVAKRIDTD